MCLFSFHLYGSEDFIRARFVFPAPAQGIFLNERMMDKGMALRWVEWEATTGCVGSKGCRVSLTTQDFL